MELNESTLKKVDCWTARFDVQSLHIDLTQPSPDRVGHKLGAVVATDVVR